MRKFLIARASVGTDGDAAGMAGTSQSQISQWKVEVPEFAAAYSTLMLAPLEFAQEHLKSLAPKLVGTLEESLEAVTYVPAGVDENGRAEYKLVPAVGNRLRAVELGLRANGMLVNKVDLTHRKLSYEEKLVRHRLENGMDVPEPIFREVVGEE